MKPRRSYFDPRDVKFPLPDKAMTAELDEFEVRRTAEPGVSPRAFERSITCTCSAASPNPTCPLHRAYVFQGTADGDPFANHVSAAPMPLAEAMGALDVMRLHSELDRAGIARHARNALDEAHPVELNLVGRVALLIAERNRLTDALEALEREAFPLRVVLP